MVEKFKIYNFVILIWIACLELQVFWWQSDRFIPFRACWTVVVSSLCVGFFLAFHDLHWLGNDFHMTLKIYNMYYKFSFAVPWHIINFSHCVPCWLSSSHFCDFLWWLANDIYISCQRLSKTYTLNYDWSYTALWQTS